MEKNNDNLAKPDWDKQNYLADLQWRDYPYDRGRVEKKSKRGRSTPSA
jgi:hypothetical protein